MLTKVYTKPNDESQRQGVGSGLDGQAAYLDGLLGSMQLRILVDRAHVR